MGNDQSELAGQSFNRDDWHCLQTTQNLKVWANRRDPSFTIEQYQIFPQNDEQFTHQKDIYYLRKSSNNLVAAFFLQNQEQGDFCSTNYRQRLFIETIPIRLSDIEHIPFPDYLHLYNQCLRGFHELYKVIGYFSVQEEFIGINNKGIVKVWMSEQFEKSLPLGGSIQSEEAMVRNIVELIDKNLLQIKPFNGIPTVLNFLYRNQKSLNFEGVINEFQNFVGRYNNGKVPEKLACIDKVGGVSAIVNRNKKYTKSNSIDHNHGISQLNGYQRPQLIEPNLLKSSLFYGYGSVDKIPEQTILSTPSNTLDYKINRNPVMCTSSEFNGQKLGDSLKYQQQMSRNLNQKYTNMQLIKDSNNFNKMGDQPFVHQNHNIPLLALKNLQNQHIVQPIKSSRQAHVEQTQNIQRQPSTDRVFNQATIVERQPTKMNEIPIQQNSTQSFYKKNVSIKFVSSQPTLMVGQQNSPISREVPIIPATFTPSLIDKKNTIGKSCILQNKVEIVPNQPRYFTNDIDSPMNVFTKKEETWNFIPKQTQLKLLKIQEPSTNYNFVAKQLSTPQPNNILSYQTNNRNKQDISAYHPKVWDPIKYDFKGKQTASSSYNHVTSEINLGDGKSSDNFLKNLKTVDSSTPSLEPSILFKNPFESRQTGPSLQPFKYQSFLPNKKTIDYTQPHQYRTLNYNYQTVFDQNIPTKTNYSLEDDEEFGRNVYSIIAPQLQLGSQVSSRSKKSNGAPMKFERNLQMKYSVVEEDGFEQKSIFKGIHG